MDRDWGRRTASFPFHHPFAAGTLFPHPIAADHPPTLFPGFPHPIAAAADRGSLFPSFSRGIDLFHSRPFFDPRPAFHSAFNRQVPPPTSGVVIQEIDASDDDEEEMKMIKRPKRDSGFIPNTLHIGPERSSQQTQSMRSYNNVNGIISQSHTVSFESSSVTYGGVNRAYYTSTTRRIGGDGVIFEESKEADSTSGRASHRISRAIGNKGHSVSRKLDSSGTVDTMQTLHNLNEDELVGFERTWESKAKKYLPGMQEVDRNPHEQNSGGQNDRIRQRLALPCTDQPKKKERVAGGMNLEGGASGGNLKDLKSYTDRKRKRR